MRVRLLVKGTVQGVGFRALVKQLGRSMGLKGAIRNLSDGNMEVYCDGSEQLIQSFRKKLEYKGDPDRPFSLHVESIVIHSEDDEEYTNPPEEWEPIDVDYGDTLSTFEREMLERTEIGSLLLMETRSETEEVGKRVGSVRGEVRELKEATAQSFQDLDGKYHVITENLERLNSNIERMVDSLVSLVRDYVERETKKE